MITTDATPYVRVDDGELLGYLVPDGGGVVPVTIFGYPLAEVSGVAAAVAVLRARGLACLAEPWWFTRDDGEEVEVRISSAYPDRVDVVETEYGYFGPHSPRHRVPIADAHRLRLG